MAGLIAMEEEELHENANARKPFVSELVIPIWYSTD